MSTWQALTDWILADLAANLGTEAQQTGPYVDNIREDVIEKAGDWSDWILPAVCIISTTWRPANPAHAAGAYCYDRLYEYRLITITRGERADALADARTIQERIETRVKAWNGSRNAITGLAIGDAVQTFGVSSGGLELLHTTSSTLTDGRFGVAGLIITARVHTR